MAPWCHSRSRACPGVYSWEWRTQGWRQQDVLWGSSCCSKYTHAHRAKKTQNGARGTKLAALWKPTPPNTTWTPATGNSWIMWTPGQYQSAIRSSQRTGEMQPSWQPYTLHLMGVFTPSVVSVNSVNLESLVERVWWCSGWAAEVRDVSPNRWIVLRRFYLCPSARTVACAARCTLVLHYLPPCRCSKLCPQALHALAPETVMFSKRTACKDRKKQRPFYGETTRKID